MSAEPQIVPPPQAGAVVTKAVVRAADHLGLSGRVLAAIIGVSEATVSRMRRGDVLLEAGSKPFQLGVLLVRLFRSLDSLAGGDRAVAASWLVNHNLALDGRPVDRLHSISGLFDVIAYLDARRARV